MPSSQRPALVVLGKVQRWRRRNLQLRARVATAAAFWHTAPEPKPWILYLASDVHGRGVVDGIEVRRILIEDLGVAPECVAFRPWSNCTVVEARAVRVLARAHRLGPVTVLTHPYHAPRARRIFAEVLPEALVCCVEPALLGELPAARAARLRTLLEEAQPNALDRLREHWVEGALSALHRVDPRGRLERRLARVLRRAAPRDAGRRFHTAKR